MALIDEVRFGRAEEYTIRYMTAALEDHGVELENGIDWDSVVRDLFGRVASLIRSELHDKAWEYYCEREHKTIVRKKWNLIIIKPSIVLKWKKVRWVFDAIFGKGPPCQGLRRE